MQKAARTTANAIITDTPFHVVGAPWLEADAIIRRVRRGDRPGCRLKSVAYTPKAIPGKASDPRYRDEPCRGVRIQVLDTHRVRAFRLAVALLVAVRHHHPDEFACNEFFDVLAGSADLRERIEAGQSARRIVGAYGSALDAFDAARPRLYE